MKLQILLKRHWNNLCTQVSVIFKNITHSCKGWHTTASQSFNAAARNHFKGTFPAPAVFLNKMIPNKDNLFKFKHVDSSSKSGTGYAQFYMNVFFWRERHWALSNQHGWSLQLAIQCYKSNSIVSINECIMIWSSILHKKPLRTLFSRILTYADLDPRPLDVFAWIEEALVIILEITSDN